jgi:hypothetical protein
MTDHKHTPGTWYVAKEEAHTGSVATCHWNGKPRWEVWSPQWPEGGSAELNARLIARASDMQAEIERLRELVKKAYLDGWLDGHCAPDGPDAWAENNWQVSEARAALEGRDE